MNQPTKNQATFTHMKDGKAEDWQVIASSFGEFAKGLPDRILSHLKMLEGDFGGFPVDRLTHCLQTATLAHRDGKDDEYVVCALLHDIGDTLGTYNHADVAAVLLEPFVSDANYWMVKHHAIFQGYFFFHYLGMNRDMRDQYRDHPHFERTIEFVHKYDSPAFDPDAETLPLSYFEPMVQRVFAQPVRSLYKEAESVM
ncbi:MULTISPECIES: HD domain-containing protein [Marinobacter]|uniref:HD domain-containing protein n=1 Tax=Marinobacter TaxID=2742 RepID=UPI000C96D7D9|nr:MULTISPECIES: HD domain-containing protein [Marinobacter]MAB53927.1 phosphohydrolase [Marinobacter sp.]MBJ7301232.1 HD domain-containing protein [Marinobacter salarius]MDM8180864.1 HD domain-containing protein [Marinobacter salarius]RUT75706.1 HD domain-containing protein [Marinobacter sp. NP-6]HIO31402.1 HD domain-containing protein [Marinobacter salarius]|tara:strand:+ start:2017 stop:2610 length:594 start_codon:yes stop_codon:yes gene_type:complete